MTKQKPTDSRTPQTFFFAQRGANILIFLTILFFSVLAYNLENLPGPAVAGDLEVPIISPFVENNGLLDAFGVFVLFPGVFVIACVCMGFAKQQLARGEMSQTEYDLGMVGLVGTGLLTGLLLMAVVLSA